MTKDRGQQSSQPSQTLLTLSNPPHPLEPSSRCLKFSLSQEPACTYKYVQGSGLGLRGGAQG